jgi:uracil phosphoribosyltransferase
MGAKLVPLRAMHTTPGFPTLRLVSHPLVQHKLSILRDRETPTKIFKELVDEIAMLMAYRRRATCPSKTPQSRRHSSEPSDVE